MPVRETWFEACLPVELAVMLDRISHAYRRCGKAAQAAFLARLEAAIPTPGEEDGSEEQD